MKHYSDKILNGKDKRQKFNQDFYASKQRRQSRSIVDSIEGERIEREKGKMKYPDHSLSPLLYLLHQFDKTAPFPCPIVD